MPPMTMATVQTTGGHYRRARQAHGGAGYALIEAGAALGLSSRDASLRFCTHFADTSAVAEIDGRIRGFVGGYLKPSDPSVLFIWQVAVHPAARGHGIGSGLLDDLLGRPACRRVRHLEATITPSNHGSWTLFRAFARAHGARCADGLAFGPEDLGGSAKEEERLLRIGPLAGRGDAR